MKLWYQSKMVWFNLIMTLINILALLQVFPGLSPMIVEYLILLQGIGNIILRIWFTNTGILKQVTA